MGGSDELIDIPVDWVIARAPGSIMFRIGEAETWIPISQIKEYRGFYIDLNDCPDKVLSDVKQEQAKKELAIVIPVWLAVDRGIESYGEVVE